MNSGETVLEEETSIEGTPILFDVHGRCIPSSVKAPAHPSTRRYFVFHQPHVDYDAIHSRIKKHLGITEALSAAEFRSRAEGILEVLRSDTKTRNITKGVCVPFFLPKATYSDYGEALEKIYLEAVRRSFMERFPKYAFVNHHKEGLAGKLSIARGSRHERLVKAMQQSQVVGYYFPCLTEYSIPAAIEKTQSLPEKFLLAGGLDVSAAFVGSPDLLMRSDGYSPLLWLAAMQGEKEQVGYHFEAYGYNLTFNRRPHLGHAAEYWASGLIVLG